MNIFTRLQQTGEWLAVMFCQRTLPYVIIHFQNLLTSKKVLWHLIIHEFAWLSSPHYFFFSFLSFLLDLKAPNNRILISGRFEEDIDLFLLFWRIIRNPWSPPSREQCVLNRNFCGVDNTHIFNTFQNTSEAFPRQSSLRSPGSLNAHDPRCSILL